MSTPAMPTPPRATPPGTTSGNSGGAPSRTEVGRAAVVRVGAVVAVAAVLANLLSLLIGRLVGADMVIGQPDGPTQTVGPVPVVVATLVGTVVGTVLLLLLGRRRRRVWTAVAIVGLVVGLATVLAPLSMPAETATHLTLAAMHVLTGLIWFLLVHRAARTRHI